MDVQGGSFYFPPAQPGRRGLVAASVPLTQAALEAEGQSEPPERWVNGFGYVSDSCDAATPMGILCVDSPADKTAVSNPDGVTVSPFLTFGTDRCSSMDNGRPRAERARRNLLATESHQIESELFDGIASNSTTPAGPNRYLTDGNADDVTGGGSALAATRALARLEQGLLACLHGQRGMIHATPELVTLWNAGGALRLEGNTILTVLDTIVVAGSGYSGNDPDGQAATSDTSWAYGTSLVYLLQGVIRDPLAENPEARTDVERNTTTFLVERPNALIFAPCCVKAVHASLTS